MDLGFADICPMNPVEIVMELMLQEVDLMVAWAYKVPGFRELDREDRANLFSSGKCTKLTGCLFFYYNIFWKDNSALNTKLKNLSSARVMSPYWKRNIPMLRFDIIYNGNISSAFCYRYRSGLTSTYIFGLG